MARQGSAARHGTAQLGVARRGSTRSSQLGAERHGNARQGTRGPERGSTADRMARCSQGGGAISSELRPGRRPFRASCALCL
eukprot:13594532-Alexandrium_andersonii.AAC.1